MNQRCPQWTSQEAFRMPRIPTARCLHHNHSLKADDGVFHGSFNKRESSISQRGEKSEKWNTYSGISQVELMSCYQPRWTCFFSATLHIFVGVFLAKDKRASTNAEFHWEIGINPKSLLPRGACTSPHLQGKLKSCDLLATSGSWFTVPALLVEFTIIKGAPKNRQREERRWTQRASRPTFFGSVVESWAGWLSILRYRLSETQDKTKEQLGHAGTELSIGEIIHYGKRRKQEYRVGMPPPP